MVDSTLRVIRVFDRQGRFLRNIAHERADRPTGIAIDRLHHRIYVADSFNGRVAIHQLLNTKAEDSFRTLLPQPEKVGDLAQADRGETVQKPITQ